MGTKSQKERQRRRLKKSERVRARRRRAAATGAPTARAGQSGSPFRAAQHTSGERPALRARVAGLVNWAAHAECSGRTDGRQLAEQLAQAGPDLGGAEVVRVVIEERIDVARQSLLSEHWLPLDVAEILRRRAGVTAARLVAGERGLDPQCSSWPADVRAALQAIHLMDHLPPLQDLGSIGGRWSARSGSSDRASGVSEGRLAKIRALLAKAESTSFADEADALTAKASELMVRHRIDRSALLANAAADAGAGLDGAGLEGRRVWIDEPYLAAKRLLLSVVARSSGCEAVGSDLGFSTVVGQPEDIDMTELLFTSLLVQATRQMTVIGERSRDQEAEARARLRTWVDRVAEGAAGTQGNGEGEIPFGHFEAFGAANRRSPGFRRSFLVAFASRIGTRLEEAKAAATDSAASELGPSFLPVLASQEDAVDRAVEEIFGELTWTQVKANDRHGWAAGVAAADLADLCVRDRLSEQAS